MSKTFGTEKDLVLKSYDEMRAEMEELISASAKARDRSAEEITRSDDLRSRSIDLRLSDPEQAEALWTEAEEKRELARDLMRQSVEMRIRAAEIKYRLDIHDQIEAISDEAEELWRGAIGGRDI